MKWIWLFSFYAKLSIVKDKNFMKYFANKPGWIS